MRNFANVLIAIVLLGFLNGVVNRLILFPLADGITEALFDRPETPAWHVVGTIVGFFLRAALFFASFYLAIKVLAKLHEVNRSPKGTPFRKLFYAFSIYALVSLVVSTIMYIALYFVMEEYSALMEYAMVDDARVIKHPLLEAASTAAGWICAFFFSRRRFVLKSVPVPAPVHGESGKNGQAK